MLTIVVCESDISLVTQSFGIPSKIRENILKILENDGNKTVRNVTTTTTNDGGAKMRKKLELNRHSFIGVVCKTSRQQIFNFCQTINIQSSHVFR